MVTDPILNNIPFKDFFDFKEQCYDSFYELYDDNVLLMDELRTIYSQDILVNEKINKGFDYVKKVLDKTNKK